MAVGYGLPAVIVALTVTGMNYFWLFKSKQFFSLFFKICDSVYQVYRIGFEFDNGVIDRVDELKNLYKRLNKYVLY